MRGRLPRVGTYTGDGSSDNRIDLGFQPAHVRIVNITDGDKLCEIFRLEDGTTKALLINDSGSGTTDLSIISSNAPTISSRGFTSGTDASLIESAKVFYWVAF